MDLGPIKQKIKQNEFLKKIVFYSITSPMVCQSLDP